MHAVRALIKHFLFRTGLYKLSLLRNRFYIILYHLIVDEPNGFYPEISTRVFETQIAHFTRNYNVISLDEIVERAKKRRSLRRCLAITFDDGLRDNYENAYPILRKYNVTAAVPAIVFLTTGYIQNGIAPWFIKLRYIFMKTSKISFHLPVENASTSFPMRTREERFAASCKAMAHLRECSDDERLPLLVRLSEKLGVTNFDELEGLMLTWEQIREMSANGVSFGAHTVNHPVLSRVPLSIAEREIFESKKTIEEKTGKSVTSFAYPFGKKAQSKPELFPILERLQFKCAVTTEFGPNTTRTNFFTLNRSAPWETCLLNQ